MVTSMREPISPTRVRYIKLGEHGRWEKDCLEKGTVRIGFGTGRGDRLQLCLSGRWNDVADSFVADGKDKGTATRFSNELRIFFEDDGSTLWITFVGERLYWGLLEKTEPVPSADLGGVSRTVEGGWRWTDLRHEPLTKDRLSGTLTKLAGYRGTSCDVDVADYVIRRVNGERTPQVDRAVAVSSDMKVAVIDLLRLLAPQDFELLVDLVFSTSGWRRLGIVGRTQQTLDLDLILPSTGDRAFVQVKSKTTSAELAGYVAKIQEGTYDKMFYVFHSGEADTKDKRVTVIGPEHLADLVMNAGLVSWLISKVS
jgi:hypothetical protein